MFLLLPLYLLFLSFFSFREDHSRFLTMRHARMSFASKLSPTFLPFINLACESSYVSEIDDRSLNYLRCKTLHEGEYFLPLIKKNKILLNLLALLSSHRSLRSYLSHIHVPCQIYVDRDFKYDLNRTRNEYSYDS